MTDQPTIPPVPPAAPAYAPTQVRTTNAMAIVSLISGILGWSVVPWLGSIIAVITGHMARAEIRRNPETQEGDGLAIAGLVLGWAMLGLSILGVVLVIGAVLLFGTAILAAVGLGGLH